MYFGCFICAFRLLGRFLRAQHSANTETDDRETLVHDRNSQEGRKILVNGGKNEKNGEKLIHLTGNSSDTVHGQENAYMLSYQRHSQNNWFPYEQFKYGSCG